MTGEELRKHCYSMGYSDGEVDAFYDGYHQGRVDAINDFKKSVKELVVDLDVIRFKDIEDIAELLEEQDK